MSSSLNDRFGAESVLIAPLQVERPITLNAASLLLRHSWPGQKRLQEFFWAVVGSLEEETEQKWIDSIRPPPHKGFAER
jgi:hypothetical protein